ncbi:MAG: RHS repeat-associated core domain-containing protein, partial [Bacteroidota bacterium]
MSGSQRQKRNTALAFASLCQDKEELPHNIIDVTNNAVTSDILQENHYYPFGLGFEGPWLMDDAGRESQYQYNGKELNEDFGLNWLDYGARWYDASIARWNAVDPLAEEYSGWSSYSYALNNP